MARSMQANLGPSSVSNKVPDRNFPLPSSALTRPAHLLLSKTMRRSPKKGELKYSHPSTLLVFFLHFPLRGKGVGFSFTFLTLYLHSSWLWLNYSGELGISLIYIGGPYSLGNWDLQARRETRRTKRFRKSSLRTMSWLAELLTYGIIQLCMSEAKYYLFLSDLLLVDPTFPINKSLPKNQS